ncbi:MAG TPA: SIMPL domain-containing protein [Solirubrobacteraceae bacterium]|nr:SIMPL domain-containing protein [Solirubrobacteraceae bacterium]
MHVRIAVAAVVMSLLCAPAALGDTTTPTPTLSVDGSGSVMVMPDVASLTVNVTRSALTSSAALGAANRRVDAIVGAVRAAGVPAAGIQTDLVDVSRGTIGFGPRKHRHFVRRYIANESVSITTTAALAGRVIDVAVHAGADSINGPSFSFSDPSARMVAATNAALADARRRADAAAATLGYVVTGVQAVNLDPQTTILAPGSATPAPVVKAPAPTPTTVHPGTQEVDASVTVVFTIAPG